jgi:hypothetical protein
MESELEGRGLGCPLACQEVELCQEVDTDPIYCHALTFLPEAGNSRPIGGTHYCHFGGEVRLRGEAFRD